jgi:hypothetical protein
MFNNEAPYKHFFSEKEYPIIKAIHDCDKDKILDMMHKGWNVNSVGKHGMSYLLYAVWERFYITPHISCCCSARIVLLVSTNRVDGKSVCNLLSE